MLACRCSLPGVLVEFAGSGEALWSSVCRTESRSRLRRRYCRTHPLLVEVLSPGRQAVRQADRQAENVGSRTINGKAATSSGFLCLFNAGPSAPQRPQGTACVLSGRSSFPGYWTGALVSSGHHPAHRLPAEPGTEKMPSTTLRPLVRRLRDCKDTTVYLPVPTRVTYVYTEYIRKCYQGRTQATVTVTGEKEATAV